MVARLAALRKTLRDIHLYRTVSVYTYMLLLNWDDFAIFFTSWE